MAEFALPDVGEGLTEAVVLTWHVKVGDTVSINDVLVDIETAKSIVGLPSPFAGVVTDLLVEEGETVAVGTPIVHITESASTEAANAELMQGREPAIATVAAEDAPVGGVLVGYGPRSDQSRRRRRQGVAVPASNAQRTTRVLAKPPVRHLAKTLGVDLAEVPHEGECVTRRDLEDWLHAKGAGVQPTRTAGTKRGEEGREALTSVRKAMAEAMVESAFTAPQASVWKTCDVSSSIALLDVMRNDPAYRDTSVSILTLAARAVLLALGRHPEVQARWEPGELVFPEHTGLGIAVAADRGLLVPVIAEADQLTTPNLAARLAETVALARSGRTAPADFRGGSFTITNVGVFGVDGGTPILVPGQSAILALGAVERKPWVDPETDELVPRWVMTLSLGFDHRVLDGKQAATFLADVASLLTTPALAVTF
jgi:2-oxoisovalerate dehydrogenase E2 component (dihydrolipoyl transacylase)